MTRPRLVIVVAVARNGVIGRDGDLPWRVPSDLKRFKAATLGKPVLMGRKTWDSLPRRPLPGRPNIVVSTSLSEAPGAILAADPESGLAAAMDCARQTGADEVCLIGGARLYAALLDRTDRIILTEIDLAPQGDAIFPALDPARWRQTSAGTVPPEPGDEAGYVVRVLHRV